MADHRSYQEFYRRSLEPVEFWREQAKLIHWHTPFKEVLEYSKPPFAWWFVGGETNLCYNALDRHLPERAHQRALIYISTETGEERGVPADGPRAGARAGVANECLHSSSVSTRPQS